MSVKRHLGDTHCRTIVTLKWEALFLSRIISAVNIVTIHSIRHEWSETCRKAWVNVTGIVRRKLDLRGHMVCFHSYKFKKWQCSSVLSNNPSLWVWVTLIDSVTANRIEQKGWAVTSKDEPSTLEEASHCLGKLSYGECYVFRDWANNQFGNSLLQP